MDTLFDGDGDVPFCSISNCVTFRIERMVVLGDSKHPTAAPLVFTMAEWEKFASSILSGVIPSN